MIQGIKDVKGVAGVHARRPLFRRRLRGNEGLLLPGDAGHGPEYHAGRAFGWGSLETKFFLSSTIRDLLDERRQALQALHKLGEVSAMELWR